MPKLSGLTTDGEATVPLGDLSPYTEEQLLQRVHRINVLFACMDCKKSWVELKEMLRHMVDGDCQGEDKGSKSTPAQVGMKDETVVQSEAVTPSLTKNQTRPNPSAKAAKDAVAKVLIRPKPAVSKETADSVVTSDVGNIRRSSRLSSGAVKRKSALALLGIKPEEEEMELSQDETEQSPAADKSYTRKSSRPLVHEIVLPEAKRAGLASTQKTKADAESQENPAQAHAAAAWTGEASDVTISIEVSGEIDDSATRTEEAMEEDLEDGNEPGTSNVSGVAHLKEAEQTEEDEEDDEQNPQANKLRQFGHLFTQRAGAPSVRRSEKAYRCESCKARFFETEVEMEVHQSCHAKDGEGFQCCVCLHPGKTWNSLLPHLMTHEEMKEKLRDTDMVANIYGTFRCTLCKKDFDKLANLKLHISKVHYKQPSTCTICGETFITDEKTFKRHVDKCAGITYQCEHCKYNTMVQDNMAKHMKVHIGKGFGCDLCSKVFPTRQRRDIHALKHNPNRTKHVCEVCAHEFCSQDAVKKHILRMHSGLEAKYKCDVTGCQFTCKLPLDLRKHNVYVHQKKYKCSFCDYQSNSKTAMDGHKAYHNPGRKFPCHHDQCFYRGVSMKQLSNHISQVHRLSSKHQCPICQRWYKKKTHLARHLVSHTGDKPYSCLECGESYATHSAYYRHRNQTGHDAKREGIVSVPQNITIKYITDDFTGDEQDAETLYMTHEQQEAIHSLISIPQQTVSIPNQEEVEGDEEVVEHIVEQVTEGDTAEEQTIYLDADGRGTATAVVDGKEVTYVLHMDDEGQYHVETTDMENATVVQTTQDGDIIETVTQEGEVGGVETQTIVMESDENVTSEELEQIKEVIFKSEESAESQTVVEIAQPGGVKGDQQYAILMVPPDGNSEPVSEAALSMLQLQSSGVQ